MRVYVDWLMFFQAIIGPLIVILVWVVVDRVLLRIKKMEPPSLSYFLPKIQDIRQREMFIRRSHTFHGLFFQTLRFFMVIFFISLLLWMFGVNLSPVIAGVGVVGLAVSLGAQNLFRDVLNGFFIITEDQFNVGDWIEVGGYSGTVEAFTLRTTRLRTIDGQLVIIPNSSVTQVVNHNKDWAVSRIEIGTSYSAKTSEILALVKKLADEFYETQSLKVLEPPTVQGIIDFRPSDVLLRVLFKTLPGSQWEIGRAFRCLVKERFDALGIDIPFQQIVIHRAEEDDRIKRASDA